MLSYFRRQKTNSSSLHRKGPAALHYEPLEDRRLLATYSSGIIDVVFSDLETVSSAIEVGNVLTVDDINVTLNISHNNAADLDVFLMAPGGTTIELFTDVGGRGNHFSGTTLDDEASSPITSGSAPFSGSYQPEQSLSGFDNADGQGMWTLFVTDDKNKGPSSGGGTLNSWSIEVTPQGPTLPSISIDDVQLVEGDSGTSAFVFTVSRTGDDLSNSVTVDYATIAGTATQGMDYVGASGTVQFLATETSQTITVQVNGDTTTEANEAFSVVLFDPTNATIADGQGNGTIFTDEPNDPLFGNQWSLYNSGQSGGTIDADIDTVEAWNITTGSLSTVVAIIDNGVEYFHEDLYLNIWLNEGEIPSSLSLIDTDADGIITFYDLNDPANANWTSDLNATGYIDAGDLLADPVWENGIDEDANGYPDDLIGWDFRDDDNDPYDPTLGHGTAQAGRLGAIGDNGVGIAGINWRVRMMPVVWQLQGVDRGVDELNYAVAQGATISNNSYGNDFVYSQAMYDAIEAAGVSGHLFVAAAGNNDTDNDTMPFYPASYDLSNVISVTSTDHNDIHLNNYGAVSVDVAGPTGGTWTTGINGTFAAGSNGTSASTPHVAGVAALLQSHYPNATASQIRDLILGSVDLLPSLAGITVTGGRVNAATALQITTIGADPVSVVEGNSSTTQLAFEVRWSGDTVQPVTADWSTSDGTATAGSDYVAAAGQLVFDNPALDIQTITIDVLGDSTPEPDETLFINISITSGNAVLVETQIVGTIENDDQTPAFTIVMMPDTQFYSSSFPTQFNAQTQWIADNLVTNNIEFVSHVGDIVQHGGGNAGDNFNELEWTQADTAVDILDGDLVANPDGLIPYSIVPGNHDFDIVNDNSSATRFLDFFGPSRYSGRSWHAGQSGDQTSFAQRFNAGGWEFLHLGLEWSPHSAAIAWAQGVIDASPEVPVILSTHSYLGTSQRTSIGEQIFQNLVSPNAQIFMVLSGHVSGEYHQVSQNNLGLDVIEILADYQSRPNGGDGWMRLLSFSTSDNRIDVQTYSPTLDQFETDNDSQFSLNIDFADRFDVPTVEFSDSFENGQWNGWWVEDGQNDWFTSTQRSTDGSYSAEVDGRASNATLTVANPIDLSGYSSAKLSFDWLIEGSFDGGEYLALDFFDGSTWTQNIRSLNGNVDQEDVWHQEPVQLDPQYLNSNFQFRYRANVNKANEDANVDNVVLVGNSGALRGTGVGSGSDVERLDSIEESSLADATFRQWHDERRTVDYAPRIGDLPGNDLRIEPVGLSTGRANQFPMELADPQRWRFTLPSKERSYYDNDLHSRIDQESASTATPDSLRDKTVLFDKTDFELTDSLFGEFDKLFNEFEFELG